MKRMDEARCATAKSYRIRGVLFFVINRKALSEAKLCDMLQLAIDCSLTMPSRFDVFSDVNCKKYVETRLAPPIAVDIHAQATYTVTWHSFKR